MGYALIYIISISILIGFLLGKLFNRKKKKIKKIEKETPSSSSGNITNKNYKDTIGYYSTSTRKSATTSFNIYGINIHRASESDEEQLKSALEKEDYEEAARLRDKIKQQNKKDLKDGSAKRDK